jgi:hypothetical protein
MFRTDLHRIELREDEIDRVLNGNGQPVYSALQRGIAKGRDRAKVNLTTKGLVDTGNLRNRIDTEIVRRGRQLEGRIVARTPYAIYVHEGTSGPIMPRTARALRFRSGGSFVFARSVRGTRETGRFTPFLKDARDSLSTSDFL